MDSDPTSKLTVALFGPLRVCDPLGVDITPNAAKNKALVALLCTSPTLSRSRGWLQAKLWSTRYQKQAADSLRQALAALRKDFGDFADAIVADRGEIGLHRGRIDILPPGAAAPGENEFLQGLDVRDPEFENWLATMRAHYDGTETDPAPVVGPRQNGVSPRLRPTIIPGLRESFAVLMTGQSYDQQSFCELAVMDAIVRTAQQSLPVIIYREMPDPVPDTLVRIHVQTAQSGEVIMARATVDGALSGRSHGVYHENFPGPAPLPDHPPLLAFVNRIVTTLPSVFEVERTTRQAAPEAALRAALAVQKMFTMRDDEFQRADKLLADAADVKPLGLYLAWRAQLLALQYVERRVGDVDAQREQCEALARRAIELAPFNSYVLATVANARHIFSSNNPAYQELVRQSLASDPGNPLGWWADANAKLYAGHAEAAYRSAITAQLIADRSPMKSFSDFQRALTAAVTGRTDEAIIFAEAAAALVPHFRPPLRYLVALYALKGDLAGASHAARRLTELEPDFRVERLIADDTYPVSMMRRANLIDERSLEAVAEGHHDTARPHPSVAHNMHNGRL